MNFCSFKKILAGTVLAATATLGVANALPVKATPSPGEDWNSEPCIRRLSVSDNVVDNTIRVQVSRENTCPIAGTVFLYIQDDGRPQPLRIPGTRENLFSSTWIFRPGDARPGRYRVMGLSPTPAGIGDYSYITSRELEIDQVLVIAPLSGVPASLQPPHPVAPPPPVVVAPPQRVVTTLDSESKLLLRNFDQWMRWLRIQMDWLKANWPQLEPLIRAIEPIQNS